MDKAQSESNTVRQADKESDYWESNLLASLPKENGWGTPHLYLYQGFWAAPGPIRGFMSIQQHFQAQDTDLMLATMPKSGTTWLKALMFAIANRERYTLSQHPLLTSNPHELVPFLESNLWANKDHLPDLSKSRRLFSTHVPYHSLPESIKSSTCRVIYLCRNPYDTFISYWHFVSKYRPENLGPLSLNDGFDMFCRGVIDFGPFWDHVLSYWKESLQRPHKVLFFMYEDLKEDIILHMKRIAEFMGVPFSSEEEKEGVIEEISRLCSFSNLRELEVNKNGVSHFDCENKNGRYLLDIPNNAFFRRGEIGDSVNHLTSEMVERLNKTVEEKLSGSGLTFKTGFEKNIM